MAWGVRTSPSPLRCAERLNTWRTMRPTDIVRAFFVSLIFLGAAHSEPNPTIACVPKTDKYLEKRFCEAIVKEMASYKPKDVALNRTLTKSTITFAAWSYEERITLGSVLVNDPIGKNTIKLMFAPPTDIPVAVRLTIDALGKILRIPATEKNVGWIVTVLTQ
jgi:hypothetical protein